ncbi:MAG: hypothetical protein V5A68_05540 [Candidatus Thermoplasmatota archaeon]
MMDIKKIFKKTHKRKKYPFEKKTHKIKKTPKKTPLKEKIKQKTPDKKQIIKKIRDNIIEIILIIIALTFLTQPTAENIKIALTLSLIASYLILIMIDIPQKKLEKKYNPYMQFKSKYDTSKIILPWEKKPTYRIKKHIKNLPRHIKKTLEKIKNIHLNISEKITIVLITWTLFLFVTTPPQETEIYFILIFIGILITKELTDTLTPKKLKKRINIFIATFLIAYIAIITQKILEILNQK